MTTPFLQNPMMNYAGPGLGGLWAGEQQQLAVNDSVANNNLTLEQIATAQANRNIAEQKLPLELERMREEIKGMPGDRAYKEALTKESSQRVDRNNYSDYLEDLLRFKPTGTPADSGYMAQIAKTYKLDPSHPLVKMAEQTLMEGGPDAFKKLQDAVFSGSSRVREEGVKQENALALEKARGKTQMDVEALRGRNQKDLEQMRIDAGKYDKAQKDAAFFLEKALSSGNYQAAAVAYDRLAQLEAEKPDGLPERVTFYRQKAMEYRQASQAVSPGAAPKPGSVDMGRMTNGQIPTNPGVAMPGVSAPPGMGASPVPPSPVPPQPGQPQPRPQAQQTRTIYGKTYVLINGQWYEQ